MSFFSRKVRDRGHQLSLVIVVSVIFPTCDCYGSEDAQWFPLRNNNPFLQVYGLPSFQDGTLVADGETSYSASLDIANHADAGQAATESIIVDGESYFVTLSLRHGATGWLELGVDLPLVSHTDGIFDNAIESWHDIWGMSNTKRSGPANQLRFFYDDLMGSGYELVAPSSGVGDIQLTAAIPIKRSNAQGGSAIAIRSSLKIPTGDSTTLRGSGSFDFSLGVFATQFATFADRDLRLSGFVGALFPGDGTVLPVTQRSVVPFGGVGVIWRLTDAVSISAQTYAQGAYLDSGLDEIGGSSVALAIGASYRIPRHRVELSFALVEDVFSDATADVGLHFSLRSYGRD